jgi:carboxyl-terminal processing protease
MQKINFKNKKILFRTIFCAFTFLIVGVFTSQCFAENSSQNNKLSTFQYLKKLNTIFDFVQRNYVDDVDAKVLYEGAVKGLMESLDDPYTSYLDEETIRDLSDTTTGNFGGVGLSISKAVESKPGKPAYVEVASPIEDSPGAKAGILAGDYITEIDGKPTAPMTMQDVLDHLRGEVGKPVTVTVLRGKNLKFSVELVRALIEVPTVKYGMINSTGYLRIIQFTPDTPERVQDAIDFFEKNKFANMIIDLRDNPGGLITSVADVADKFIDGGVIVSTKSRISDAASVYTATPDGTTMPKGIPIVVLINKGSASASEILAGAIQDHDRGLVVGRRSFGKGLVQRPVNLPDGSMIRLTISKYYTPSGRCIQKPYEKGKEKEYRMDVINRFNSGELTNADSIHFPDSLKFQTLKKGRTVYGGGGIMPDYFVPLDTTQNTNLYRQIVAKRILVDANLRYLAKNRTKIKEKYPTFEDYKKKFKVPEVIVSNIFYEAEKQIKGEFSAEEKEKTAVLLKQMLRALIARDLWDMNEYFAIIYEDDDIVNKALQLLEE